MGSLAKPRSRSAPESVFLFSEISLDGWSSHYSSQCVRARGILHEDRRSNRAALFDGIEEGGVRASYNTHEFDEHGNDTAIDGLQDRVNILKRLTGDIHEEVEIHNSLLDKMGHNMDASRGTLYGNMDRFNKVFHSKSNRTMAALVASFIVTFFLIYYLIRYLSAI